MSQARFRRGDRVRARLGNPSGHTRVPSYVRGRTGEIESVRTAHPLPDHSPGIPKAAEPETVYSVRFSMAELWGADADTASELVVELWESYLEALPGSPDEMSVDRSRR